MVSDIQQYTRNLRRTGKYLFVSEGITGHTPLVVEPLYENQDQKYYQIRWFLSDTIVAGERIQGMLSRHETSILRYLKLQLIHRCLRVSPKLVRKVVSCGVVWGVTKLLEDMRIRRRSFISLPQIKMDFWDYPLQSTIPVSCHVALERIYDQALVRRCRILH